MSDTQRTARVWHVRGHITSTVKDGFRVDEITVSCDFNDDDEPTIHEIRRHADRVHLTFAEMCADQNRALGIGNGTGFAGDGDPSRYPATREL